jgi:predicted transglutaminase-like cysteine proteinase
MGAVTCALEEVSMLMSAPALVFLFGSLVPPAPPAAPAPVVAKLETATTGSLMRAGVPVTAPSGFLQMCARDGAACAPPPPAVGAGQMSEKDLLKLVRRVNRRVNNSIEFENDQAERWSRPGTRPGSAWQRGDCEDYAIEKRHQLLEAGFPEERLFYAVGYRRAIGLHAVLVARIGGRDLVLDNRTPWVRPYAETAYTWVAHQAPESAHQWRSAMELSQS